MPISNTDKFISGYDLATELEVMRGEKDDFADELENQKDALLDLSADDDTEEFAKVIGFIATLEEKIKEAEEELSPLEELEEDIFFPLSDVVLISTDEFEDYCTRFAVECGDISESSSIYAYVDWERYADAIRIDYTSVDFEGEEFLYRS